MKILSLVDRTTFGGAFLAIEAECQEARNCDNTHSAHQVLRVAKVKMHSILTRQTCLAEPKLVVTPHTRNSPQ